jgi:hypothetical protein
VLAYQLRCELVGWVLYCWGKGEQVRRGEDGCCGGWMKGNASGGGERGATSNGPDLNLDFRHRRKQKDGLALCVSSECAMGCTSAQKVRNATDGRNDSVSKGSRQEANGKERKRGRLRVMMTCRVRAGSGEVRRGWHSRYHRILSNRHDGPLHPLCGHTQHPSTR